MATGQDGWDDGGGKFGSLPVDADETTGLGVADVVEVSPELFDALLADVVDCASERHLCLALFDELSVEEGEG